MSILLLYSTKKEGAYMIYAIARIDKSSRARLSWIQSFAASFGIVPRPIYGHITLCTVEESNLEALKTAVTGTEIIPVNVESVAVLDNAPAVAAMVTAEGLDDLRRKLGAEDAWTPHIELLRDSMVNPNWVLMAMKEMFQPFTGTVDRIEFVQVNGRGFDVLDAVDLT